MEAGYADASGHMAVLVGRHVLELRRGGARQGQERLVRNGLWSADAGLGGERGGHGMSPAETLAMAQQLLARSDPKTAGLCPRAAALLARQALEQGLDDYWRAKGLPLHDCGTRPQLICLAEYLGDAALAGRAHHTWAALSEASHHHPYELAPGHGELTAWIDVVGDLLPELAAAERSQGEARSARKP